jgi:regulator of replication initiation timing
MARRAAVTPGTDPTPDADIGEALVQEGVKSEVALSENEQLRAELADLRNLVKQLGRNQIAQSMPEKVELPSMADVLKTNPKVAVLTKDGWFVPLVHPTDRIAKV